MFFNVPPRNKNAGRPNLSWKTKAIVFTTVTISTYQDQLNTGLCEILKIRGIESLKYVRVLHTGLLLWGHFHTP